MHRNAERVEFSLRALAGRRLAALAARGLLLGARSALLRAAARTAPLAATARGARRVRDPRGALLGHPLVLERLVLLLVLDAWSLVGHAGPVPTSQRPNPRYPRFMAEKIMKTDEEWRRQLTPEQYKVLRKKGTERPWTGPLNSVKEPGVFRCAGCGAELFRSDAKFESGSGWPSFYEPAQEGAVERSEEHTSELQSHSDLVCRLLLEKKKKK